MGISNDFYPSIKTLISKDSVSQKIGTVQGGLDLVLDNLFYKELILQQSRLKDSIFASFSIVSYKRLGLEFPGTGGLSLILNPGIDSQTFTEFPVSLSLQNPVKRFLSKVSITSLSQDPNEIFSLLRKLADVSDGDIILAVLNTFFGQDSTLESFVIEVNSKHGTSLSIDYSLGNEKLRVEDLVVQINSTHSFTKIIYDDYLYDADFDKVISNIINLFEFIFGDFTIEDVLELFIPVVEVSIDKTAIPSDFYRLTLSHYTKLNLFQRFKESSHEVIDSLVSSAKTIIPIIGIDEYQKTVKKSSDEMRALYGHNHWKSLLQVAIVNHEEFESLLSL